MKLAPFGKLVMEHSALTPVSLWQEILRLAIRYLNDGSDWPLFFDELIAGCQELRDGKLQEILCLMDEQ